jgi:hypothetical protein
MAAPENTPENGKDEQELAAELERTGYQALFRQPAAEIRSDALWGQPDAPARLLCLATDVGRPWRTRFLAAELIFRRQMFLLQPEHFASLAPVYARALAENATEFMTDWGFVDGMNDVGTLGSRFVLYGGEADPALRPLLADARPAPYGYPPESFDMLRLGLRFQDFAALYLGRIHGIPLYLTADPDQRDGEIRRLERALS